MKKIGADEAGRGPVIGSLFICAYYMDESTEPLFREKGVKDSKLLTASKRAELYDYISSINKYSLIELTAEEITKAMQSKISLNELEAQAMGEALNKLPKARVIVDSPDPIPSKFARRINKYYDGDVTAENKADTNHIVAAAASIIAKESREKHVALLKKEVGDFGSGYPSDPKTKEFLEKHHADKKLQKYLRHEWKTMKKFSTCNVNLTDFQ